MSAPDDASISALKNFLRMGRLHMLRKTLAVTILTAARKGPLTMPNSTFIERQVWIAASP